MSKKRAAKKQCSHAALRLTMSPIRDVYLLYLVNGSIRIAPIEMRKVRVHSFAGRSDVHILSGVFDLPIKFQQCAFKNKIRSISHVSMDRPNGLTTLTVAHRPAGTHAERNSETLRFTSKSCGVHSMHMRRIRRNQTKCYTTNVRNIRALWSECFCAGYVVGSPFYPVRTKLEQINRIAQRTFLLTTNNTLIVVCGIFLCDIFTINACFS